MIFRARIDVDQYAFFYTNLVRSGYTADAVAPRYFNEFVLDQGTLLLCV